MQKLILALREKLEVAVKRNIATCLLFSGGLDTSILAFLNPDALAITISLESSGEDIKYAESLAKRLNLRHYHKNIGIDEAIDSIPTVIKILKSFDPAIPNDLVVYFGLKTAKELGVREIMTGDGADELFAGYSYMKYIKDLEGYIKRIASSLSFSSNELGDFFEIKIIQPYLDRDFLNFALQIPADLKIKKENDKIWGKWILRKAYEDVLPPKIIWQSKRPLEYGSGMTGLRQIVSCKVSDEELKGNTYPVRFMSKEHFYYYKIYKKVVGEIPEPKGNEKVCPGCSAGIDKSSFHCKICGYVLDWRR
ncbi:MAG: asparagine synthase-related protein [Thermodesulfovibrionales bacterium]|nr:asparagine synthase-related protein [Thermodesulfovibrionales bacterium]